MKEIVIVQQVSHEGVGLIGEELRKEGIKAQTIRVYAGDRLPKSLSSDSSLIVLGGPMGVYEDADYPFIKDELTLIEDSLGRGLPVLGICLGAQLMACAAGAKVYKGDKKEIGWYKVSLTEEGECDRLFMGLPKEQMVFQWHGDTFDIPKDAVRLAGSELFPNQLIRIGAKGYGLQFHLEVTADMVREWLSVEENVAEIEGLNGQVSPERIVKDTPTHMEALARHGSSVFSRFLRL